MMSWLFLSLLILSVCRSGFSASKMVKIVQEPANYGGMQSYQSNNPQHKSTLKPYRKEAPFSGPYHLRQLAGKCFSLTDNSYKYELCPFFNVTQHEQTWRWNAFHGILGIWKEWSIINNTFEAMVMTDGDECPGDVRRKSKVFFKCGNSNTLLSVKEPSTCSYEVIFKTPLACPVDAFLVYPMLSAEGQKKWEEIEESLYHQEITMQGYKKERQKLFVRAGLVSAPELNKKITSKVNDAGSESGKKNLPFVPKTKFDTKQDCIEEYSNLLHEYLKLRQLLEKQSSEKIKNISQISNVELTTEDTSRARGDVGLINSPTRSHLNQ